VLSWVRLAYMVPIVAAAGVVWGVQAVAVAATLTNFVFVPLLIQQLVRVLPLTAWQIVGTLLPPAIAAGVMAIVLWLVDLPVESAFLRLVIEVAIGAVVYASALAALWQLAGRPAGPEGAVIRSLIGIIRSPSTDHGRRYI
jgi:hypothetical protein